MCYLSEEKKCKPDTKQEEANRNLNKRCQDLATVFKSKAPLLFKERMKHGELHDYDEDEYS